MRSICGGFLDIKRVHDFVPFGVIFKSLLADVRVVFCTLTVCRRLSSHRKIVFQLWLAWTTVDDRAYVCGICKLIEARADVHIYIYSEEGMQSRNSGTPDLWRDHMV